MESWDVVVLGAGVAGLAAAYEFGKLGKKVLLLEKSERPGGALHATKIKSYWVDDFYHHIFPRDKLTVELCNELGVTVDWKYATTAFHENGEFYRLTTPFDLLTFKPLSLKNKIALVRLMVKIKRIKEKDYPKYDHTSAEEFLVKYSNKETYERLFKPLLTAKFGSDLGRISAAWLIERLRLRNDRNIKGERLGYVRGGFQMLTQAMAEGIGKQGGKLVCQATIKSVKIAPGKVTVIYNHQKEHEITAKTIVSTLPPHVLMQFVKLPEEYAGTLRKLEYQGACCVLVGLSKPLTPYYWTNILANVHFGAVIEQTDFVNPSNYEGDHLVYFASYPDSKSKIWKMSDEEVWNEYNAQIEDLFGKQEVRWHKVFRMPSAGLIYHMGIQEHIVPVTTPIQNLYVAGMFNSYPERSIDRSVALAQEIVKHETQR